MIQDLLGPLVVLTGVEKSKEEVIQGVVDIVRTNIGPVASFKLAVIVPKLPKTRSGKIARKHDHSDGCRSTIQSKCLHYTYKT